MQNPKLNPWKVASASGMSLLLLVGQTAPLMGNPTGGTVVAGGAAIGAAGPTLTVNQSTQNAIINWQTFSIANGETTKFIVPNNGATLNRVAAGNPSQIYGNLQSNGTLYLVNPSGIVVGPNGRIDTAGFMASTLDVSNQQFLAGGNLEFAGTSDAAINNGGTIHASMGDVYLIANQVNNTGKIIAPQGNVGLAAGSDVLFQQAGNQHLFVQATPAGTTRATGVNNAGTIRAAAAELKAAGGNAYALAINNTGVIAATGYKKVNGQVYLTSDGGSISNSGKISAKQKNGNGGTIAITGTASSGAASKNTVTNSGTLNASATKAGGTGGTITVKNMTGTTIHSGAVIAKGGQGGAGGNAEVSGNILSFAGTADLTAAGGKTGTLLLDPVTLDVYSGTGGSIASGSVSNDTIDTTLQTASVVLSAQDSVTIDGALAWTGTSTLTIDTTDTSTPTTININAPISAANGTLMIQAASATDVISTGSAGGVNVANFLLGEGAWTQVSGSLPAFHASHNFVLGAGTSTFLRATSGDGTISTPYLITDVYGLQGIATFVDNSTGTSNFSLANNIDASGTSSWNSGGGFVPIGNVSDPYVGTFNGRGFAISNIVINGASSSDEVGLFGYSESGVLENVGLINASVTGGTNTSGVLAGFVDSGTVTDCYATGTLNAPNGDETGGLIGAMNGTVVKQSYSGVNVTGNTVVGGLVGAINSGTVQDTYAYGTVTGNAEVGGLIGSDLGTVTRSYASGLVTGTTNVGGFMGLVSGGTVSNNFFDTTTSGQTVGVGTGGSTGVTGDSTSTLLTSSTYVGAGWNIGNNPSSDTWVIFNGETRPMLAMEYSTTINTAHQLQLMTINSTTETASYTVANNIDASGTSNASDIWGSSTTNGGGGFVPVASYSGTFNGNHDAIDGLYIDTPSSGFAVGLFSTLGMSGTVNEINLTNAEVIGGTGNTGILVGNSSGIVENSTSSGTVITQISGSDAGGLVGANGGTITNSSSSAAVSGQSNVGGLAGFNSGSISESYSTGQVTGLNGFDGVGGLVGDNSSGTIASSYSSSPVTGGLSGSYLGGFVGVNGAQISNAFATGNVTAGASGNVNVGGFAGMNSGTIQNAYSTGLVTGNGATGVGGFVGTNGVATINNSFWATDTSGQAFGVGNSGSATGLTGATTAQLQSQAYILANSPTTPTYDFTTIWTTNGGTTTPQLIGLPQASATSAGDTLTGTAFLDSGITAAGAGLTIDALSGGIVIGTATTSSGGSFTFTLTSAQLTGGVLLTDATDKGNTYIQFNSPSSSTSGVDIWGSTLRTLGDTASNTALGTAAGSVTTAGVNYTLNGTFLSTAAGVNLAIASNYLLDGVTAANDIVVDHAINTNTSGLAVLIAGRNVTVNANITNTGGGGITLQSGNLNNGIGTVAFGGGATVSTSGPVTIFYNPSVNPAGSAVNTTSYANPTENYAPDVTGGGTLTAYMLVNTLDDLQNIKNNLSGTYALSHDIDASATSGWNGGAGFVPIGDDTNNFVGTFNGQGFAINNLFINLPATGYVGLFGEADSGSKLENVNLVNAAITGGSYTGALVGLDQYGTIASVSSSGTIDGSSGFATGGVAGGSFEGSEANLSSSATVTGNREVGGLVGFNESPISNSYSTGSVNAVGTGVMEVGGLVGIDYSEISESYSTGSVTAPDNSQYVGGLVGLNLSGSVVNSYSTGAVVSGANSTDVGGLVGYQGYFNTSYTTSIINSYTTGSVTVGTGSSAVGGFIGQQSSTGSNVLTGDFWDTDTAGSGIVSGVGTDTTPNTTAGVLAVTTAQLKTQSFVQSHSSFDFTNVWSTVGDTLTPQLIGLPQTALPSGPASDTLSGTAFIDSGTTAAGAGLTIDFLSGGIVIGTATTASGGVFTFSLTNTELTNGVLLTDATDKGNTYLQLNSGGSASGIDIWGSTLRLVGDTSSLSALATAAGSNTSAGINYTTSGGLTTNANVNLNILSSFSGAAVFNARNIVIGAPVNYAGDFIANATGSITINSNVTAASGGNALLYSDTTGTGVGTVTFGNGAQLNTSGQVVIYYNPSVNPAGSAVNSTSYVNPTENYASDVTGGAQLTAYMLVNTLNDLQNVKNNLTGTYAQGHDIDATPTATWNGGAGFVPIGFYDYSDSSDANSFSGVFNGNGFSIHGLTINLPSSTSGTGLFGDTATAATVENLILTNVNVTGATYVGGVFGVDNATTTNVTSSGTVTGTNYVGGLAGIIAAVVSDSSTSGTVTGNAGGNDVGGLIGFVQGGSVTNTFSTAAVSGFTSTGGLVGNNRGTIQLSYSTGSVTAETGFDAVGGLVGYNSSGVIEQCYSTSPVMAIGSGFYLGGLVGANSSQISDSYAAGPVTGTTGASYLGGLVGQNVGTVHNTLATGLVTANGATEVGGFAGRTTTTIENSFFDTDSSGQTFAIGDDDTNTDVTPATTAQLTSQSFITAHAPVAQTFDFTNVWTTVGGTLTPQLIGLPQTALPTAAGPLDTLSGTAYLDEGSNFSAGVLIELISGGSVLGSTTTNGSGQFTFSLNASALGNGILLTDATDKGNTFFHAGNPTSVSGVDIWGSTVRVAGDAASNAALASVVGSLAMTANGIQYSVAGGALTTTAGENFFIYNNYDVEGNITARGSFLADAPSTLTGTAAVTLTGSDVSMFGAINRAGALTVTSTSGPVLVQNVGTTQTPATVSGLTINSAQAVDMVDSVLSIGTGGFSATGTGYTSTVDSNGEANGINLFDTSIASSGAISLMGTAGYTSDGNGGLSAGQGVFIGSDGSAASELSTTGSANLSITGTFNSNITSSSLLAGVIIQNDIGNASNTVSVADGRLIINGTVSQGTATDSVGVDLEAGPVIEATGAGLVTITGTESATSATFRTGVHLAGAVSTVDGALNIGGTVTRGTGGSGSVSLGVGLFTGSSVAATGLGSVTVMGDTTATSATINAGVYGDGATLAAAGASGLEIDGYAGAVTGATGTSIGATSFNPTSAGILLTNGSSLSATNSGSVRMTGVAGPNDSTAPINAYGADSGVRFDPFASSQITVTSAGGGIAITGTAGSGAGTFFNVGVNIATATIMDTGDGAINITGTGGAGDSNNAGVTIEGSSTKVQAGMGSSGVLTIVGHAAPGVTGTQNDGFELFNNAQLISGGGGIAITGQAAAGGTTGDAVTESGAIITTANGVLTTTSTGGDMFIGANMTALSSSFVSPANSFTSIDNASGSVSLSGGNYALTQVGDLVLDGGSVQALTLSAGAITQSAPLTASLLTIASATSVTLTDPANRISGLGDINSTGAIDIFSDPGMTISGVVTSGSAITIAETGGPLTLAAGGQVIETGSANIILAAGTNLANSNYFINNSSAGSGAVDAGSGNFYLFSSDPTFDQLGGITFDPANLVYNAVYPTSASTFTGSGNAAFYYVAGSGQVGPNNPNNNQPDVPNTTTGGAAGAGSNIVPPVLVTQVSQILPQEPGDGSTTTNPTNYLPNGGANDNGTQPPPFSFTGTGVSQLRGELDGGLANSASNSGQVTSGDIAQLNNGQYSNVSNPQAADQLEQALGPIVYSNLADALRALGDWADVPDAASDTAAGNGETILTGGDVAEMTGTTAKKIPLSEAPEQLQNAMKDDSLKGASH